MSNRLHRPSESLTSTENSHVKQETKREQKIRRRKEAIDRRAQGAQTPEGQLNELDIRLGKGVGAKKERARLARLIK